MNTKVFDPKKLHKLNNPERLKSLPAEFIIERLAIKEPKTIVDFGAGTGFYSIPFAKQFPQSKIYAFDISNIMINWMKENITNKYKNISPIVVDSTLIPLENEFADIVFMINLHHEIDDPRVTLKECYRILKPKGKIAISDWKKKHTNYGPPFEIRYQAEKVKEQLLEAGFTNSIIFNELEDNFLIIAEK